MTGATGRVVVITAHPDDAEFGAGRTVAKLVKVTDTMDLQLKAVTCHASQAGDFKAVG